MKPLLLLGTLAIIVLPRDMRSVRVLPGPVEKRPAARDETIAYPEGYRDWTHVKSSLTSPSNKAFAGSGGFHHIYANAEAMKGYRTRVFPQGSVIVFDWLEMTDTDGAYAEGPRRQIDVMVRDTIRFGPAGWGFQRFAKDSHTELAATPTPAQCLACHQRLAKDGLVLSQYRH